ncbi:hypothetical protein AHAS_Ahas17G0045700 [Arachis hypogaea]
MSALLTNDLNDLSLKPQIQSETGSECEGEIRGVEGGGGNHVHREGLCAICLDKILLQDTALVKGCEHAYCVTCILRWATYRERVTCPQCKHPFDFLFVHRSLDGSIQDYMFEESVCLLLRAAWFQPLKVENHVEHEDAYDPIEDFYQYRYDYEYDDEDDDDLDEVYYGSSSSLRIDRIESCAEASKGIACLAGQISLYIALSMQFLWKLQHNFLSDLRHLHAPRDFRPSEVETMQPISSRKQYWLSSSKGRAHT